MQNLYETVKKAQMVVQVEAVRVQKELAVYVYQLNHGRLKFKYSAWWIPQFPLFYCSVLQSRVWWLLRRWTNKGIYIYIYISFFLPLFGAFVLFLCCNLEFARSGNMHEKPYLVLRKTYLYILIGSSCWNLLKVFLSFIY